MSFMDNIVSKEIGASSPVGMLTTARRRRIILRFSQRFEVLSMGRPDHALFHWFDVCVLHNLAQVVDLLAPKSVELLWARSDADDAELAVKAQDLGMLHRLVGLRRDSLDDLRRRSRRRKDRSPILDRIARQRIGHRRDFG